MYDDTDYSQAEIDLTKTTGGFVRVECPVPKCKTGLTVHESVLDQMLDRSCRQHQRALKVVPTVKPPGVDPFDLAGNA